MFLFLTVSFRESEHHLLWTQRRAKSRWATSTPRYSFYLNLSVLTCRNIRLVISISSRQKHLEATGAVPKAEVVDTDKKHKELDMLCAELEGNLNALTNFTYTPHRVHEDLTVIANVPSIKMEEGCNFALHVSRLVLSGS